MCCIVAGAVTLGLMLIMAFVVFWIANGLCLRRCKDCGQLTSKILVKCEKCGIDDMS